MAWIFYDKILGHKVSAMGACIGSSRSCSHYTSSFVTIPHAIFIGALLQLLVTL
jgi:Amt family ammonium transporter